METTTLLREEVKSMIDNADEKTLRIVHAMLEAGDDNDWLEMPDEIKTQVQEAIEQADAGLGISHEEVKKKYPQWFAK